MNDGNETQETEQAGETTTDEITQPVGSASEAAPPAPEGEKPKEEAPDEDELKASSVVDLAKLAPCG